MTVPHKPELSGVKAQYAHSGDETERGGEVWRFRDVIAWDKLG